MSHPHSLTNFKLFDGLGLNYRTVPVCLSVSIYMSKFFLSFSEKLADHQTSPKKKGETFEEFG